MDAVSIEMGTLTKQMDTPRSWLDLAWLPRALLGFGAHHGAGWVKLGTLAG